MKATMKKILLLILTVVMTVFVGAFVASCGEDELGTLKSSKILYDGTTITWAKVKGAKEYLVSVNGGEAKSIEDTKLLFSAGTSKDRDVIEVSIQPIGKEEGKKVSRTFTRLPKMDMKKVSFSEEGVMSWEEVEGADEYILSIGGTEVTVADLEYSAFTYDGKSKAIKIRPSCSDGSTFSAFSTSTTKTFLAPILPETISYDGALIKWRGAGNNYKVYIDGAEMFIAQTAQQAFDAEQTDFFVEIQAIGDGVNSFSSPLSKDVEEADYQKTFMFLEVITDAAVVDGNLVWSEVEHADRYSVKINGLTYETQETTYPLTAGQDLNISVKAVVDEGEVYFSAYSDEFTAHILETPTLKWNNYPLVDGNPMEAITWKLVDGNVKGYAVKLTFNGQPIVIDPLGETDNAFVYDFLDHGTYTVSVQATGAEDEDTYSSKFSREITVVRLEAPDQAAQGFITSDPTNNSKFTLTWKSVSGAKSYQIWKDGVVVDGLTTTNYSKEITNVIDPAEDAETKVTYGVQSIGEVQHNADETTRVVLSSLIRENLPAEITVLAMPTGVNIADGSTDLTWTGVSSANGYAVKGVGSTIPAGVTTESYSMKNLSRGDHNLQVCAKGNGGATLASNYTVAIPVCRLSAPENIRIGIDGANEGTWQWSPVPTQSGYGGNGYTLAIKGQTETQKVNIGDNINDLITTSGTTISVAANANEWLSGVYYLTSAYSTEQTFTKLQTPTFSSPIVRDRNLVWNEPTNKGNFSVSYNVYKNEVELYANVQNAPQMLLNSGTFTGGGTYPFRIKAIGNGTTYINSDMSEMKQVMVLPSPVVKFGEKAYEWEGVSDFATGYKVTIGEETDPVLLEDSNKYSYDPVNYLKKVNSYYDVQITATGYNKYAEDDSGLTVIDSWPTVMRTYVDRLKIPTISVEYQVNGEKATQCATNGELVVKVSEAVPHASGYSYMFNNTNKTSVELEQGMTPDSSGTWKISASAIGGTFDSNGTYYIDSEATTSKIITLLGSPSSDSITKMGNTLKWGAITGATKYKLILTYADGDKTVETQGASALISITDLSDVLSVQICAVGNGTNVIDSAYTDPKSLVV